MPTSSLEELGAATKVLSSTWVSEVVLQTAQFDRMKAWYQAVLGRDWFFENQPAKALDPSRLPAGDKQVRASDVRACFMRLAPDFPYGTTLALFELSWLEKAPSKDPGINHMQFRDADIATLIKRLELLRDAEINPHRSANHGPSLSFYFRDPDKNVVELCINNFDSPQDAQAFTKSAAFKNNPSGLELDRDEFISRYHSGVPKEKLLAM